MLLRYPAHFEAFRCIADRCPDSCCKEWEVLVDEDTAQYYLQLQGNLGEDLRRYLHQDAEGDWYLRIEDRRCPMWRRDGLCRIQAALGHDALCETCREFPRLTHDYGDFVERGLELSCPEAARLIFAQPNAPWVEQEISGGEAPDYDPMDMQLLRDSREKMLSILADTSCSVQESLVLGLLYGYQAQSELDGGEGAWDEDGALLFARGLAKPAEASELVEFYKELEILTPAWRHRLEHPAAAIRWDERLRTLAIYGVQRYWLQTISDFDLVGRVKMIIASCLLVHALGGDLVQTAQLYAKEIENNADNLDAILKGAYSHPALTDEKLLGILLEV